MSCVDGGNETISVSQISIGSSVGIRAVAADIGVCFTIEWRGLRDKLMQPFHEWRIQCLNSNCNSNCKCNCNSKPTPSMFCEVDYPNENEQSKVFCFGIFHWQVSLTGEGIFNTLSEHIWTASNFPLTTPGKYREKFSVNSWTCIHGNRVFEPYLLPNHLVNERRGPSWFISICSVHQANIHGVHIWWNLSSLFHQHSIQHFLNAMHHNRWIRSGRSLACP